MGGNKQGKKVSASELRKKEKECRKLQQELKQEKEKFSQMVDKYTHEISDIQVSLISHFPLYWPSKW